MDGPASYRFVSGGKNGGEPAKDQIDLPPEGFHSPDQRVLSPL